MFLALCFLYNTALSYLTWTITLDQYENGSNLVVSIIFRMIEDFSKDNKMLPPVLFLNLDNCGRENKVSLLVCKLLKIVTDCRIVTCCHFCLL